VSLGDDLRELYPTLCSICENAAEKSLEYSERSLDLLFKRYFNGISSQFGLWNFFRIFEEGLTKKSTPLILEKIGKVCGKIKHLDLTKKANFRFEDKEYVKNILG
jgi:hypothetical protein